jgi:hypothetical protein
LPERGGWAGAVHQNKTRERGEWGGKGQIAFEKKIRKVQRRTENA